MRSRIERPTPFLLAGTILVLVAALGAAPHTASAQSAEGAHAHAGHDAASHTHHAPLIEVEAEDYAFRVPTEIPSGWNTFRFTNEGEEHHFMLLLRIPEGYDSDDYMTEVWVPMDEVWALMRDGVVGQEEGLDMMFEPIPEWYGEVVFSGGPGLVAPGGTVETTVYLEPGQYVVECYMKTPEGEFHAMEGMFDPLTVTEASSGAAPPSADIRLTLSNYELEVDGELAAGRHTIAVHYADQPDVEGIPGHDVHLVHLDEDGHPEEVAAWMSWVNIPGLMEPAPGTFLGGVNPMPVGSTAYFTVDLVPGRYLFVSEYTGAMGVMREFRIQP